MSSAPPDAVQPPAAHPNRNILLLLSGLLVLALLGATMLLQRPAAVTAQSCAAGTAGGLDVGACAPDFTLQNLQNKSVTLSQFQHHPVMVHFWAINCSTCQVEYPDFARIARTYGPKGLVVLAVDAWGEPAPQLIDWQSQHHLAAQILVDIPSLVNALYGNTGVPATFFIDRRGHIAAHFSGALSYADYVKQIKSIL